MDTSLWNQKRTASLPFAQLEKQIRFQQTQTQYPAQNPFQQQGQQNFSNQGRGGRTRGARG